MAKDSSPEDAPPSARATLVQHRLIHASILAKQLVDASKLTFDEDWLLECFALELRAVRDGEASLTDDERSMLHGVYFASLCRTRGPLEVRRWQRRQRSAAEISAYRKLASDYTKALRAARERELEEHATALAEAEYARSLESWHKAHARKAGMLRIQKALAERDAKAIMQDRAGTALQLALDGALSKIERNHALSDGECACPLTRAALSSSLALAPMATLSGSGGRVPARAHTAA